MEGESSSWKPKGCGNSPKKSDNGYGWIEELGLEKLKASKDPTREISPH